MYTTLQNNPVDIDLTLQARSTGWVVNGKIGTHERCNAGTMFLNNNPLVTGGTYKVSYQIASISGGLVRIQAGNTLGVSNTTAGFKQETIIATGPNPIFSFYSTADCVVELLDYQRQDPSVSNKKQNTVVYNEKLNKWVDYRSFVPDIGFSMFTYLYTMKNGNLYIHDPNNPLRNNFYGVQYDTIIQFVHNTNPEIAKCYVALNYQANTLLITTTDGLVTSQGQISDLIEQDFLRFILQSGATTIPIYQEDGFYEGYFLRDKNTDLITGDFLKGTYMVIELKTINFNQPLKLLTIGVSSTKSYNAIR